MNAVQRSIEFLLRPQEGIALFITGPLLRNFWSYADQFLMKFVR
jgi:hypothetical protein